MIPIPSGVRVWIATGHTDMRRGMQGLALQVQESCSETLTLAIYTFSEVAAVILPRFSGTTGSDYRFTPSAWIGGSFVSALGEGRRRFDLGGADGLYVGRDRLAKSATNVAARERRLANVEHGLS